MLFTLDESTYSASWRRWPVTTPRRLGPPWWFHDSIEGMLRFRDHATETAGIYNTAGFNDDTRAFLSIPARHDVARRVDATFLAHLVTRHIIELQDAEEMIGELAYGLGEKDVSAVIRACGAFRVPCPSVTPEPDTAPLVWPKYRRE